MNRTSENAATAGRAMFYVGSVSVAPQRVWVKNGCDNAGRTVYENTHFAAAAEAWKEIEKDIKAMAVLAAREIERLEAALRHAQSEAGEACKRWKRMTEHQDDVALAERLEKHEGSSA